MTLSFKFGTVGSPKGMPKKPGGSVGAVEFSRSIGLDALELGWVQSVRVTEATCAAIKAKADEQGVALSVHAPYFINLNAKKDEWPKSRKRLMDAAHYGHLAGGTDIVFHPGSYFGGDPAEVLKVALPRLEKCGVTGGYAGDVEDRGRAAVPGLCTPARASRRWDGQHVQGVVAPAGGVCLGVGRAGADGAAHPPFGDRVRAEGREESPAVGRSGPGLEGALQGAEEVRLRREDFVRKPGDGGGRADDEEDVGEVVGWLRSYVVM